MTLIKHILAGMMAAGLVGGAAQAGILVQTGGGDFPGDSNVISNACSNGISGPTVTVVGCLNSNHAQNVFFTAEEDIIFDGGQAVIRSADRNGFTALTISLDPDQTFATLILNIHADRDGWVTFDFDPVNGGLQTFALTDHGNNLFRISGEDFGSIHFTTTSGVQIALDSDVATSVGQVRLGGVKTSAPSIIAVSEPASGVLLASSLFALALMRRKRSA